MASLSRIRSAFLPAALSAAAVLVVACSVEDNYETLSFWFDGVPTPEQLAAQRAAAETEDLEAALDPGSAEAKAARAARINSQSASSSTHQPVLDRLCADCHRMTAARAGSGTRWSADGQVLLAPPHELCLRCHEVPVDVSTHGPVASGNCSICHFAHSSPFPHLLRNESQNTLCTACHQPGVFVTSDRHKSEWLGRECVECHDPHASSREHLLREVLLGVEDE